MITVTFMGEQVEINEGDISQYCIEESVSLEQALLAQFNPYAQNFENLERELLSLLGRQPSAEEVQACLE